MNTSLLVHSSIDSSPIFNVFTLNEKHLWSDYVKKACITDFYYTCSYQKMDNQGDPFLFVYEVNGVFVAVPLIKRQIEDSGYFDCTCVYGYTGPFSNVNISSLSADYIQDFKICLTDYLISQKIVSVFSVLHPFSNQQLILNANTVNTIGKTVAIDLRQPVEAQRAQYRRPVRQKINQLRKKDVMIKMAATEEELLLFADIYRENMSKVNASSKYLFNNAYFKNFMEAAEFETVLLLAYINGEMAAGAMIVFSGVIAQLHLAGTRNKFLKDSPMKLIFDEASLIGRAKNMQYLHLGSGVGGKDDSLFHFKAGFSTHLLDFNVWNWVVDQQRYDELVIKKLLGRQRPSTTLFPLYRFL